MIKTLKKEIKKVATDVVVVGGGTAGFAAAIAAGRNGAKVILIEQHDYLGGTLSGGMVNMIRSMRHMQGPSDANDKKLKIAAYESSYVDQQLVYSIAQEFVDRMIDAGSAWGIRGQAAARQFFDPEMAKVVIEKMLVEAGVDVWFYSQTTDVLKSGKSVDGIVVENLEERIEIAAKVTIDATGNGDVCANAGASFELGNPDDGHCQPLTLYFTIGNIDFDRTLKYMQEAANDIGRDYVDKIAKLKEEGKPLTLIPFKAKIREALEKGEYPIPYNAEKVVLETLTYMIRPQFKNGKMRYNIVSANLDMAYNVDATDRKQLTKATIAMRDIAVRMAAFYRKYIPGFEDSYLGYTAPFVGIRDTRRIIGDYFLSSEDVLSGKAFEDGIGRYGSVVDVHDKNAGKKEIMLLEVGGKGWFHVPYRIMLPKGLDNILVAGRCVSADHIAQGCTRSQAACILTGQAAGTAATLAIKSGVKPREVSISELQKVLIQQNQII
ncbi:FAD-dependent oxidoreductase [Desulfosporosinus sp. SB140]|uniref:FAD-dependent oxidoreductase n=1 Tax=Desulfosporosinus paludis TaxID=3115649 RepID=UPI0038909324